MNSKPVDFSFLLCALAFFAGCSERAAMGQARLSGSYQDIREQVIRDFFEDPIAANEKYKPIFSTPSSADKKQLVSKLIVCGQLVAKGMDVNPECQDLINGGLKDPDDEVRALTTSALAFSIDGVAQDALIKALNDPSSLVKIEAAQALSYQFDTLSSDPNDPDAPKHLRQKLLVFCQSNGTLSTSASNDLCKKI